MIRTFSAAFLAGTLLAANTQAQTPADLPHLVSHDGHNALMVDGAPFLMLVCAGQ